MCRIKSFEHHLSTLPTPYPYGSCSLPSWSPQKGNSWSKILPLFFNSRSHCDCVVFGFVQELLDAYVSRQLRLSLWCPYNAPISLCTDSYLGLYPAFCNYLFAEWILSQTMYFLRAEIVLLVFSYSLPLHFPQHSTWHREGSPKNVSESLNQIDRFAPCRVNLSQEQKWSTQVQDILRCRINKLGKSN